MPVAAWWRNSQTMSRRTRNADMHARRTTYTDHANAQVRKCSPRWRRHRQIAGDGEDRRHHRLEAERAALDEGAVERVLRSRPDLRGAAGGQRPGHLGEVGVSGRPAPAAQGGSASPLSCRPMATTACSSGQGRRPIASTSASPADGLAITAASGAASCQSPEDLPAARHSMRYASTASTRAPASLSPSISSRRPPGVVGTRTRRPGQSSTSPKRRPQCVGPALVADQRRRVGTCVEQCPRRGVANRSRSHAAGQGRGPGSP